jgi:hypothetical protein
MDNWKTCIEVSLGIRLFADRKTLLYVCQYLCPIVSAQWDYVM